MRAIFFSETEFPARARFRARFIPRACFVRAPRAL
jgi:hypothetical protein